MIPFLRDDTVVEAARAGLRSLFIGFESLSPNALAGADKRQNLGRSYRAVVEKLDGLGIMINGSFVFGLDGENRDVFPRTVDWAVASGITTATFHILTPYPGTKLHAELSASGRIVTDNWDAYDTRQVVYEPRGLTATQLKAGYDWAYKSFYSWSNIARGASRHAAAKHQLKHFCYSAGWKKFERLWNVAIRLRQLAQMRPMLEAVLSKVTSEQGDEGASDQGVSPVDFEAIGESAIRGSDPLIFRNQSAGLSP